MKNIRIMQVKAVVLTFIYFLLSVPNVSAFSFAEGLGAVNMVIASIAQFALLPIFGDYYTQIGLTKFLAFIIVFATGTHALKARGFDSRPAAVIAFAAGAIGGFMMPDSYAGLVAGLWPAILGVVLIIAIFLIPLWLALVVWNRSRIEHLLGILLLIAALFLISTIGRSAQDPAALEPIGTAVILMLPLPLVKRIGDKQW